MAFLPAAIAVAGTLFSGAAAMGQANYKAKVAERNAQIARQNAVVTTQQAQVDQMRQDREMAALEGSQLAQQSASGLDVLGHSQLLTRATTRRTRNEGAVDIRRQGEAQTASYYNQAAGFEGQASSAKSAGISSMIGSVFDATSIAAGPKSSGGLGLGESLIGGAKSRRKKF